MGLRSAVSVAIFLTLLAGCDSPEGKSARAGASSSPTSPSTALSTAPSTAPSTAGPSAEPSPAAESTGPPPTSGPVHRLGDRARLVTGSRMTVFSWQRVRRPGSPAAGTWWAADVAFCLTRSLGDHFEEPIGNIRSDLRVELSEGPALTAEADARRSDEVYAQPVSVVAGRCRRGKLVFDIAAGAEPTYLAVTFSPFGWVRWQLS
jgi:hypothetical protein